MKITVRGRSWVFADWAGAFAGHVESESGGVCENFAHGPGRAAVFETISSAAAAQKPPEDKLFCCFWDKLSCVGRLISVFWMLELRIRPTRGNDETTNDAHKTLC